MASTKVRTRNRNRFGKQYPLIRRRPVNELVTEYETIIEVATLTFTHMSAITHTFNQFFPGAPSVTAIAKDVSVNVFVTSVSRLQVTIQASDAFTGSVYIQAIYVAN